MIQKLLLCFFIALLSGCSTIMTGSESNVKINSYPPDSIVTVISTSGKTFFHGPTPATVRLPNGDGYFNGAVYFVSYQKDGFQDASSRINSKLNPWYIGNIFNIFGFFIVDPMNGSMWTLEERTEQVLKKRN